MLDNLFNYSETLYQYDTMIYPAMKEKGHTWIPSLFQQSKSSTVEYSILPLSVMQEMCCNFYFLSVKDMVLMASYPKKCDLSSIVTLVISLFQCCYEPKFLKHGLSVPDRKHANSMKKVKIKNSACT